LLKSGFANGNHCGMGFDWARAFVFRNKFRQNLDPISGRGLLLYNVHMPETKAVRLTETVKAAG